MMWTLAIINALGLTSGIVINEINTDGRANMIIANEFVCFWVLVCTFILMVMKCGNLCVLASAIQCLIFQLIDFGKDESKKDIVVTLVFIAELIISFAYLI